jgi:hypothetical protein
VLTARIKALELELAADRAKSEPMKEATNTSDQPKRCAISHVPRVRVCFLLCARVLQGMAGPAAPATRA